MGALHNADHERYAQELSRRLCAGEKQAVARTGAYVEVFGESPNAPHNARRLANQKPVKDRVAWLNKRAFDTEELADIDRQWCMLQLVRRIRDYNPDDYLGPKDPVTGRRHFDVSSCSREQLAKLAELYMEEEVIVGKDENDPTKTVRKTRIKPYDATAAVALIAKLGGFEPPQRHELSGPDGKPIETKEVSDSMRARALAAFMAKTLAQRPKENAE